MVKRNDQIDRKSPEDEAAKAVVHTTDALQTMGGRWLSKRPISGEVEYCAAAEDLGNVKRLLNDAEVQRKSLVDPLNQVIKKLNAIFKPATVVGESIESAIKNLLVQYDEARRKAMVIEAEKLAKKAEKKSPELAGDIRAMALTAPTVPVIEGVQFRTKWSYEVEDIEKVPRAWLCLDETKVGAFVRAEKDKVVIPGIRIFEEKIIAASGK